MKYKLQMCTRAPLLPDLFDGLMHVLFRLHTILGLLAKIKCSICLDQFNS